VFGMTDTSGNSDLMIAALMRSSASVSAQRAILAAFAAGADGMSLET